MGGLRLFFLLGGCLICIKKFVDDLFLMHLLDQLEQQPANNVFSLVDTIKTTLV